MMANYSLATWLLAAAIVLLTIVLIALPLLQRQRAAASHDAHTAQLRQEQAALLASMRALDEDLRMGKLSQADHAALRADLVQRGARVMQDMASATSTDVSPPES